MNLDDRNDPTLMLLIFIGAITAAAGSVISDFQPGQILPAVGSLAPLLLGAFAIASALAMQRLVSTNRTLRNRRTVAVVPADEFDPKPDEVLRFAGELGATERSVRGWFDRRASVVRVTLTGDAEGRLVYLVSVPERSLKFLRGALSTYDGVELREPEDVLGGRTEVGDLATCRTELVLGHKSLEPLGRLSLEPDPLRPFAAALEAIRPAAGEELSICVDLLPATGWRRTRLRRRLQRQARRRHGERRSLREVLDGPQRGGGRPGPDQLLERRLISEALDAKLRDSGALFEAQVLVRCRAANRAGAKATMQRVLGGFAIFAAQNWFRARGLPIPGVGFLGSDLPLVRGRFDRRMDTGLFRPGRRMVVTASEMAGFLKPPNVHCKADNVVRAGTLLGAAPKLPTFEATNGDLIPLGRVGANGKGHVVGVRTADTFFSYIAGRSRYGKTELAVAQFVHVVRSGHGGLFLDPHGDALERIKPYLRDPKLRDKVVEINLGPGHPALPGWNLFELGGDGDGEDRVDAIVDAFSAALEWGERSSRAINLTTQAATALVSIARVLPPELAPTIFQLPTLLSDEDWRQAAMPFLPRASQRFWEHRFPLLASEAVTPLTNLVDRLRAMPTTTRLLGQSESTYRVREAMDEGQIVLVCPGSGGARDRLIANLIVFDLLHTARRRAEQAPAGRKPFWVFLDEVQSFDGGASGSLAGLLEQSAKFGLRAVLLNQNPERLSPQTLNALTTNRSHLLATALNSQAAALLTKEWGGELNAAVMARLPRYRFVAQVTHEGDLSRPFALQGIRVEDVHKVPEVSGEGPVPEAARHRDTGAVIDHLEGLDERIQAHLEGLDPPGGAAAKGDGEDGNPPQDPFWLDGGSDED